MLEAVEARTLETCPSTLEYSVLHTKAMRRPEAKAALDKDLNKLKNLPAWDLKKGQTTGRSCTKSKK